MLNAFFCKHCHTMQRSTMMGLLVLLTLFQTGCSHFNFGDKITEGILEYEIEYTNNSGRGFPIQLLPKTMTLKFNHHFAAYTIEDRVGLFSISVTTNLKDRTHLTLIKVFDKKYVYKADNKETPIFFRVNAPLIIKLSKDTMNLAGVHCLKAKVTDSQTKSSFDVAYTTNIDVKKPNQNTPYADIDGLLMKFVIQMKHLDMALTAKKIKQVEIDDKQFAIPDGYKLISKSKMEEIITTLLP
jgi:hypothetical protein